MHTYFAYSIRLVIRANTFACNDSPIPHRCPHCDSNVHSVVGCFAASTMTAQESKYSCITHVSVISLQPQPNGYLQTQNILFISSLFTTYCYPKSPIHYISMFEKCPQMNKPHWTRSSCVLREFYALGIPPVRRIACACVRVQ